MTELSPEALRQTGLDALQRELGLVGMVRFLQQFGACKGDYTADRWRWLPEHESIEKIAEEANRIMAASGHRPE